MGGARSARAKAAAEVGGPTTKAVNEAERDVRTNKGGCIGGHGENKGEN